MLYLRDWRGVRVVECTAFEKRQAQKASGVRISPSPQRKSFAIFSEEEGTSFCNQKRKSIRSPIEMFLELANKNIQLGY